MRTFAIVTAHRAVCAAFCCVSFQFTSINRPYHSLTSAKALVEFGVVALSHRYCLVSFLV